MCEKTPHTVVPSFVDHTPGDARKNRLRSVAVAGIVAISGALGGGCIANPTPHPEKPEASPVQGPGDDFSYEGTQGQRMSEADDFQNGFSTPSATPDKGDADGDPAVDTALPPAPVPTIVPTVVGPRQLTTQPKKKSKSPEGADGEFNDAFARTI